MRSSNSRPSVRPSLSLVSILCPSPAYSGAFQGTRAHERRGEMAFPHASPVSSPSRQRAPRKSARILARPAPPTPRLAGGRAPRYAEASRHRAGGGQHGGCTLGEREGRTGWWDGVPVSGIETERGGEMKRRRFLTSTLAILFLPRATVAERAARVARIGWLTAQQPS